MVIAYSWWLIFVFLVRDDKLSSICWMTRMIVNNVLSMKCLVSCLKIKIYIVKRTVVWCDDLIIVEAWGSKFFIMVFKEATWVCWALDCGLYRVLNFPYRADWAESSHWSYGQSPEALWAPTTSGVQTSTGEKKMSTTNRFIVIFNLLKLFDFLCSFFLYFSFPRDLILSHFVLKGWPSLWVIL